MSGGNPGGHRVDTRPGKRRKSAEWKARISRGLHAYHERRREQARIRPQELRSIRSSGTVPPHLVGFLESAEIEADAFADSLGGFDRLSPQRLALVQDTARLGLVMRAELSRYIQGDADAGTRVGTLAGQRRANLTALGLDRHEQEVESLTDYLARRSAENSPQAAKSNGSDADPAPPADRGADRTQDANHGERGPAGGKSE